MGIKTQSRWLNILPINKLLVFLFPLWIIQLLNKWLFKPAANYIIHSLKLTGRYQIDIIDSEALAFYRDVTLNFWRTLSFLLRENLMRNFALYEMQSACFVNGTNKKVLLAKQQQTNKYFCTIPMLKSLVEWIVRSI